MIWGGRNRWIPRELASKTSLLGEFWGSERPCLKKNKMGGALKLTPEIDLLPPYTCVHEHIYIFIHTHMKNSGRI